MVNKVILVGRLGKDPEAKHTQAGNAVTTFSVACSKKWKNRDGQAMEKTEWVNIVTWSKLADICSQYLKKGSLVYIEGELTTESWEKDGEKRYATKVVASEVRFLDTKKESEPDTSFDTDLFG